MKAKTHFMILLAVMTVLAISVGCSENARKGGGSTDAPLSNGLSFKYDVISHCSGSKTRGHETYTVASTGSDTYKITVESYTHTPDGSQGLIMAREFIVNENGIVTDCDIKCYEDDYSPLWKPVGSLKVGEYLRDAGMKVFEKTTWKGWKTYRISDKPNSINFYYELDQGFFVGTDGVGLRQDLTLIENNAGVPIPH